MMKNMVRSGAILAGLAVLTATPGHALTNRVFVSAKNGSDIAGCGAPAAPCRTLQSALIETSPGGQISVTDPGDYVGLNPPLRINKAISIVNDGAGTAMVTRGIDISGLGPTDVVRLRGLFVTGAPGIPGIGFRGASGSVTIDNCVASKNPEGVRIAPDLGGSLNFTISDVIVSNNQQGFVIHGQGAASGVISHLTAVHNVDNGVIVGAGTHKVTVADSVLSNNGSRGAAIQFCNCLVSMRDVVLSNNGSVGLFLQGNPDTIVVRLAHSVATGNGTGIVLGSDGVVVESYRDNNVRGNRTANVSGGGLTTVANQ